MAWYRSFRRNFEDKFLGVGFALAIVAAVAIGWNAYSDARESSDWYRWIAHTQIVIATLDAAHADSFSSLIALQAYAKSEDLSDLDKHTKIVSRLQRESAALRTLTVDNPSQQNRLDQADSIERRASAISQRLTHMASTIGRKDAVKTPDFAELGAALYQLSEQFDQMSAEERRLLMQRIARARVGSKQSVTVMGVGGSVVFAWMLLIGGYVGLTTKRLEQAQAGLAISKIEVADLTERKRSEEQFGALLESAPVAMVIVSKDGRIKLVNAQTEKLFGYPRSELLGNTVEMLVPVRFRDQHPQHRIGYFVDPKVRSMGSGLELYGLRKDGTEFPIEISLSPLETVEGTLVSSAIRDITERKRTEEEVRVLNQAERQHALQLEAANKELEAFSYSVSHDLRAPLRSIDGFSLALMEDYADTLDAEARGLLERIRAATQRMAQLIDDLLNLARVTRSEMRSEVVDLSAMAKVILGEFHSLEPQRCVECVVQEGVIGNGDPDLLRVVLENLLGNAWKFTMKKPRAKIELGILRRDGQQVYFVRDDGPGFDMTYANKLFGTFQRLHATAEFPGTGIGLASVRRIIHRHGGRTWAEGEEHKGATFSFTLHENEESSNGRKTDPADRR
ncbi:MAG TPA: PAS domain S-box protein [Candidatus Binataceae bacterium]